MTLVAAVLQVLLGLLFLAAGVSKLAGTRQQVGDFGRYRYPPGTMQGVGGVEVAAAVGMLVGLAVPVLAVIAGIVLIGDMLFLLYSHISRVGDPVERTVAPMLFTVLALIVVLLRT